MKQTTKLICGLLTVGMIYGLNIPTARGDKFRVKAPNIVIDQAARKIVIHNPHHRIISLYGAHTENLFQLGLDREIIGVSRHEDYPSRALKKPVFSYHDDPEKFLAARPDLVLVRPMIDRGYPQLIARLEKSGITVASLQPGTIEEMYTYWRILGALTARQQRALKMVANFKTAILKFKTLTASIAIRKRVYFEAIHNKMKTFSPDSMAIFALETAGGINAAADAIPVRKTNIAYYGKERILARGPQIDVYLAQSGAMNRPSVSMIKNEAGYQVIKAVDHNQIYIVDERIVSRPTYRLLAGIAKIGKILYPEVFDDSADQIIAKAQKF
ncbi:MAG: ABC transporter substrate-binding protein [Desulfobacterales bacterium]|jgi:iron complex transport system substrate-binding protein